MTDQLMTVLMDNIKGGKYRKEDQIAKLDLFLAAGKLTAGEYNELIALVDQCADPNYQPPSTQETRIEDLENRVGGLEKEVQEKLSELTEGMGIIAGIPQGGETNESA